MLKNLVTPVSKCVSNRQDACSTKSEFMVDGFSENFLWGGILPAQRVKF
ncbi:hypothetical protein [Microcoleus sp. Z1_B2]